MGDQHNKKSKKGVKRKGKRPWRERQRNILANARQQRRANNNDCVRANESNNSDDNASDIDLNYTHSDSDSVRANNTNNSDSSKIRKRTNSEILVSDTSYFIGSN